MAGEKYILLKDLIPLLVDHIDFKGELKIIPHNTESTGHGNCCTCSECGYFHDDCVCLHNEIVEWLDKIIRY